MNAQEHIKDFLRERKLKATPIRVALLQLLNEKVSALPYSEIQTKLQNFDRVTLYRTLNVLIDSGVVHKASTSGDETYFALCDHECSEHSHNHEHIHFKCSKCNAVSCIHAKQTIKINIPDYQVEEVSVEVSGICKSCLEHFNI